EDVDLVVHLGDYIYEFAPFGNRPSRPDHEVVTLEDYRLPHASYKVAPDLQAAHLRFPFVATWDDHEVANNYLGDTVPEGEFPEARLPERRAAAYQAWWENLPTRLPPPDEGHLAVYQAFTFGDLARLELLHERQYADVAPCRDVAIEDFGDCPERQDLRTRLGPEQEAWFGDALADQAVPWDLVGNPVVLAGIDAGTGDEPAYYLDTWDGYPDAQEAFIGQLRSVENPVVLTGAHHAGMVLDVHTRPFHQDSDLVAPELMAPPISSVLFDADVSDRTPQLRQQINGHGYLTVVADPDAVTATFRVLDDVARANSAIRTEAVWEVAAGDHRARPATG